MRILVRGEYIQFFSELQGDLLNVELELICVYRYEGFVGKRFRFRVKGTNIMINVLANSIEEATEKAKNIIETLGLHKLISIQSSNDNEEGAKTYR